MYPGADELKLAIHPRVAWQVLDGEAVLIDLDKGSAVGLNETASFLWSRLDACSEEELASDLVEAFDVDERRARHDVAQFLAFLRSRGYVEER